MEYESLIRQKFHQFCPSIHVLDSFVHHLVVIIKIIESNFFLKCVPYSKGQKIDLFILKLVFERYFDIFLVHKDIDPKICFQHMTVIASNYYMFFINYLIETFVICIHSQVKNSKQLRYVHFKYGILRNPFLRKLLKRNNIVL